MKQLVFDSLPWTLKSLPKKMLNQSLSGGVCDSFENLPSDKGRARCLRCQRGVDVSFSNKKRPIEREYSSLNINDNTLSWLRVIDSQLIHFQNLRTNVRIRIGRSKEVTRLSTHRRIEKPIVHAGMMILILYYHKRKLPRYLMFIVFFMEINVRSSGRR